MQSSHNDRSPGSAPGKLDKLRNLESGYEMPVVEAGNTRFALCAVVAQIVFVVLFAISTEYSDAVKYYNSSGGDMASYYGMYQDVHVMIFVGFGFLMTFLARHQFSALGFTFFIGALVIQWAILTNGFWHNVYNNHWELIHLDITHLIRADFVAGAVLITFGGILGKVGPLQLLVIAIIECVFQGASEMVGNLHLGAVDMGGSIFVHTFGAYFGLACSWALQHSQRPKKGEEPLLLSEHKKNGSTRTSDAFAMIGTIFLWLFWPSFNGALATGSQQHRVVINTVLALSSCCLMAFAASALLRKHHKFDMVDIQNATLAGGVAVGSSSDLVIQPWGALLIGIAAGWLSVVGYVYISPYLERRWGIHDTCGIHNLHGMPGLLGAVGGAISAALAGNSHVVGDNVNAIFPFRAPSTYETAVAQTWCRKDAITGVVTGTSDTVCTLGEDRSAGEQGGYQMAALCTALALAVFGGVLAGKIASLPFFMPMKLTNSNSQLFEDDTYWEVPEEEEEEAVTPGHVGGYAGKSMTIIELNVEMQKLQAALLKVQGQATI